MLRFVFLWSVLCAAALAAEPPKYSRGLKVPPDARARAVRQNATAAHVVAALHSMGAPEVVSLHPSAKPDAKAFSWETVAALPAMDQGQCGSCWACAGKHVLEWVLILSAGQPKVTRASAEDILSWSGAGSCGGGWVPFDYARKTGVAPDAELPYVARTVRTKAKDHPYKVLTWAFIDPQGGVPSIAAMKARICSNGPVWACVNADGFDGYRAGEIIPASNRQTDHALCFCGWDDGKQAWRIKNSWGASWGDGGYCWMAYGTPGRTTTGEGACYVVGKPNFVTPAQGAVLEEVAEPCAGCDTEKVSGPTTAGVGLGAP